MALVPFSNKILTWRGLYLHWNFLIFLPQYYTCPSTSMARPKAELLPLLQMSSIAVSLTRLRWVLLDLSEGEVRVLDLEAFHFHFTTL